MEFKLVLVEKDVIGKNEVFGASGLRLDNKFVLITNQLLSDELEEPDFLSRVITDKHWISNQRHSFSVVSRDIGGAFCVRKAKLFHAFVSENIKTSGTTILKNWAIGSVDNNSDLYKKLSVFFVISLNPDCDMKDLEKCLVFWWEAVNYVKINKCDQIQVESVPFANRNFIDSCSRGIVSNILGERSCLIFSDCPSAAGSEGGPVFIVKNDSGCDCPIGIVLSSVSWWRGEWIGCTLIADIRPLIAELIDPTRPLSSPYPEIRRNEVLEHANSSLVQIYSGYTWGTAILIGEKGIFLTNSHVINTNATIFYKGKSYEADVIYKTPANEVYDLAVIRCAQIVIEENLQPIKVSGKSYCIGDTVYSAGFPIFSKDCQPSPTFSKGCISQKSEFMLRTTCAIHPGASGGAIVDDEGGLLGIIVCNMKLNENNAVFPRINMAIPYSAINDTILAYLEKQDSKILEKLHIKHGEPQISWNLLGSKL